MNNKYININKEISNATANLFKKDIADYINIVSYYNERKVDAEFFIINWDDITEARAKNFLDKHDADRSYSTLLLSEIIQDTEGVGDQVLAGVLIQKRIKNILSENEINF